LLPPLLPLPPSSSRRLTAAHVEAMAPSSPTPAAAEAAPPPEAPSTRVDAPSVERVLWLAPAVAAEWAAARPLRLPAGSLAVVGAALARAAAAAPPSATWAVCFAEGAAWAMARGDVAFMTTLAAANKGAVSEAPRASTRDRAWLDAGAASELAAVVLAALARERHLDALVDEARMLRAEISALPPGALADAAAPLLTVAQDFARLARDAHGGFATMIRKATLRERVAESAAQSAVLWQAGAAALDAVRQQLVALTRAARFGETQLERALRRGGEWRDSRRLQDLGARLLAASHLLVLATGELRAIHGERLQSAAASLRAGQDQDRELGRRLRACERAVQGDPHERRGELESRRLQLRQLLDGFDTEADGVGARRIVAVARQIEAEQASPALTISDLLLRLGDGGTIDEVRLP